MKNYVLILSFLSLGLTAMAQYTRPGNGLYTTESTDGDQMTIIQNKESKNLTVEYSLIDSFNKAVLIVFDNSGKVIVQEEIIYKKEQLIIPTKKWPTGQYIVSLYADKQSLLNQKITFSK